MRAGKKKKFKFILLLNSSFILSFKKKYLNCCCCCCAKAMLTVFYLLGISGNIAALIMLGRNETARNKRQTLMLKCLAWNDLLAVTGSSIQMHLQIYMPSRWVLTPYFCGVRVFWRAFGLGSGAVALAMAVERWFALTKPFVYQTVIV
jgi:hypothetical protein